MTEALDPPRVRIPTTPSSLRRAGEAMAASAARVRSAAGAGVGALKPVALRIARPLQIVSALGWSVLAVAVVAAVIGFALGWAEFIAIAVAGAAVLALAVPFVLGRVAYAVAVELASPRVIVGERAAGRVVMRNTARRPSPPSRVELPVGRARAEFRAPRLAPEAEHSELFTIPTERRAVLQLGPVTSVRSDPLMLLRRTMDWTRSSELFVHPRVVSLDSETVGLLRDLEGLPTRDLANDDVSFHALREYSPGDDLRHVHWKSTARTQSMMIRQFEQTRRSHLVIALSVDPADYATIDEFELAVSITGSIGLSALRDGKTVSVLTSTGEVGARTRTQLLDDLSRVELSDGTRAGMDAAGRAVAQKTPSASVVVFVTGAQASMTVIRSASLRVPVTARAVCVRAADAQELKRRAVGDVVTVDVPELSSLRVAMRAVAA